jgi:hypothetical protein
MSGKYFCVNKGTFFDINITDLMVLRGLSCDNEGNWRHNAKDFRLSISEVVHFL